MILLSGNLLNWLKPAFNELEEEYGYLKNIAAQIINSSGNLG